MSHFTVMVVVEPKDGESPQDALERQLAPFHEFECTGHDDEYVQDIDHTEEARTEFAAYAVTRYRDTDGTLHDPYEDRFYREPTDEESKSIGPLSGTGFNGNFSYSSRDWNDGRGYRAKVHFVPDGWSEVEVPASEVESFPEWIEGYYGHKAVRSESEIDLAGEHKYGYTLLGEQGEVVRVIDRTNPNKKWDGWRLGGRWAGFFRLRSGDHSDLATKADIDFPAMRGERVREKLAEYHTFQGIVAGRPLPDWAEIRDRHAGNISAAHDEYNGHQVVQDLRHHFFEWGEFNYPEADFIQRQEQKALCTFAVLKGGKWYERGRMGWWAVVHDEKGEGAWEAEFAKMLDELPGDAILAVVDCHI